MASIDNDLCIRTTAVQQAVLLPHKGTQNLLARETYRPNYHILRTLATKLNGSHDIRSY